MEAYQRSDDSVWEKLLVAVVAEPQFHLTALEQSLVTSLVIGKPQTLSRVQVKIMDAIRERFLCHYTLPGK